MANRFATLGFLCLIAFSSAPAAAQTTALHFESQAGDYIGQGLQQTWTAADLTFTDNSPGASHVYLRLDNFASSPPNPLWWYLNFV